MSELDKGYLYIVWGRHHAYEAIRSAESLRKKDEEANITVISNTSKVDNPIFNKIIYEEVIGSHNFSGKVNGLYKFGNSIYRKTLYLDSDTWIVEDPSPLFKTMEYFDVCIAADPASPEIPTFPGMHPYQAGVIGITKSINTDRFLSKYKELYNTIDTGIYKDWGTYSFKRSDQPALTLALMYSKSNILVLNSVWNARHNYSSIFCGPVKIIHGHSPIEEGSWENLAKRLNATLKHRGWDANERKLTRGHN